MAKYQVAIEITTYLSREVEANSATDAERLAEEMYREYQQGQNAHLVGTEQRRSVALSGSAPPRWRFAPVGQ
jgi:hypothetical protein